MKFYQSVRKYHLRILLPSVIFSISLFLVIVTSTTNELLQFAWVCENNLAEYLSSPFHLPPTSTPSLRYISTLPNLIGPRYEIWLCHRRRRVPRPRSSWQPPALEGLYCMVQEEAMVPSGQSPGGHALLFAGQWQHTSPATPANQKRCESNRQTRRLTLFTLYCHTFKGNEEHVYDSISPESHRMDDKLNVLLGHVVVEVVLCLKSSLLWNQRVKRIGQ